MVAATLPELLDDESAWRFCEAGVPAIAGLRTGIAVAAALAAPLPDAARLRAIAAAIPAPGGVGAGSRSTRRRRSSVRAACPSWVDGSH